MTPEAARRILSELDVVEAVAARGLTDPDRGSALGAVANTIRKAGL